MTAGQPLNAQPPEAATDESAAQRLVLLQAEVANLRGENALLREQLSLRDQALDATTTFFVISKQVAPEPIIAYCNKVVADEHGFRRDELIGKSIGTLAHWASQDGAASELKAALRAGHSPSSMENMAVSALNHA